ncbi:MAG: hypothetical protein ABIP68_07755, partial [Ferruginibacter sp.]
MNDLIVEYLFSYKCCPLPGIGELRFKYNSATHLIADKIITSPYYDIYLSESNVEEVHFVNFISNQLNISSEEAKTKLVNYCNAIINSKEEIIELDQAGRFYVNAEGRLNFEQAKLPLEFNKEVEAVRISRANVHQILVGDTESTSEEMTGYFNSPAENIKSRWWIWALIILVIAAAIIVFYMNDVYKNDTFGNASKAETPTTQ